ncbi:MAG: ribonuclease HI [Lachnospiraceae bacterium]|nr:ribonuclease HI [Lachnospiraceae bacterium]
MSLAKVKIYTDGSARGNPDGPGGYGVILHYTDSRGQLHESTKSAGYKKTTNNRMELMGVIAGLESLTRPCEVEIISDSKCVTEAFNQKWIDNWQANGWRKSDKKPVLNTDLWKRLLEAAKGHELTFTWVKGHNDHPENERCDKMAVAAATSSDLLDDVAVINN